MLGLYVHVPFCAAICNYCNFNRGLFDESLKAQFVEVLLQEIRTAPLAGIAADTLFFGGGTPSLLAPREIAAIVESCRATLDLAPDAEITLEANPESVDAAKLAGLRRAGVNRLSFGVQSFDDAELQRLGRLHSAQRAADAVRLARDAGFDNVSLDLMMWLPGQSVAQWLESVRRAIAVDPDHLSLYMLEVYAHLPLNREMTARAWTQGSDAEACEMYEAAMALLDEAGYEQYEISNVARRGRQARHNLKYWGDGEWWGFGPGAHSTYQGRRWRNVAGTEDYVQRLARHAGVVAECRTLTAAERLGDALFTGLRLTEGLDLDALSRRYATDVWARYGADLASFVHAGLLVKDGRRLRLTRPGMLLSNEVMSVFV